MKQVPITPALETQLRLAAGADVDVSNFAVFEASALNTGPIRKNHPLYKDGRHTKNYLEQMAQSLAKESLPIQIQHDTGVLPVGRAFHAEVMSNITGSDLRVLFWIDAAHPDLIGKLNSGTIDQVSIQAMSKAITCSVCSFDFLGDEATYEHIYSGTCANGHTMGVDGVHAVMDQLDTWYELSLVGKGGIAGARVLGKPERRLAASGVDVTPLVLSVSSTPLETKPVDPKEFIEKLTTLSAEKATLAAEAAQAKSAIEALEAKIATLEAEVIRLTSAPAENLTDVVTKLAAKTGDVTTDFKSKTPAELVTLADEFAAKLSVAVLVSEPLTLTSVPVSNAFRQRTFS
jgi:hypothetical protein